MTDAKPHEFLVSYYRDAILKAVTQQRMGLEESAAFVKSHLGSTYPDLVDRAYGHLKQIRDAHEPISQGGAIVNGESFNEGWYLGAVEGGHWARYRDNLANRKEPGLDVLDAETEFITSLLMNPNRVGHKRRGLVMGNVQSGKTRNFAGVIARAVDAGYKYVIVLSGINNNLREQTQARLTRDIFAGGDWYPLTGKEQDFEPVSKPQAVALLKNQPALCAVVKKNTNRLGHLVRMIESIPIEVRRQSPVLIIDDEADQATPNSLAEKNRISAINQHLRRVWAAVSSGTYVAYTATPFANVLMDPEDDEELFPADFVTTIEPGSGYFGSERVFGISDFVDESGGTADVLNMVRKIPAGDTNTLRPPSDATARASFDPQLPDSLLDAFAWFTVATAARRARGDNDHSSMLVHTTHYTLPHFAMQERFIHEIMAARNYVAEGRLDLFRRAWNKESKQVHVEGAPPLPSWDATVACLGGVMEAMEVIVDNGSSEDRLNYDTDEKRIVIAIGGGTLSRGLTLEGLVVSYFSRTSTNTYDTLLQMGRWFGYRSGYEDLPRVWVSDGLDDDFSFLARVEKDLREEIRSLQGSEFTPRDVGLKVRAHPGRLQVTAANKMFHAEVVQLGLSGTANQTFLFDGSDPGITYRNLRRVESLIQGVTLERTIGSSSVPVARGVAGDRVAQFLYDFETHASQKWLADNRDRLREWVSKWASGPIWNVVLVDTTPTSARASDLGDITIGGERLRCANRSVLRGSTVHKLDFKAIVSQADRIRDIDPALYEGQPSDTSVQLKRIRRLHGGGNGLIVVYPISKNSRADVRSKDRADLPIDHHLLGFAVYFPSVNDAEGSAGAFVSVRPLWEVPATVDGDEDIQDEEDDDGSIE